MSRRLDITSRLLHALSFLPMCNCGCCRLWPWHSSLPLCLARRCYMTGSTSGVSISLKESRSRMLLTVRRLDDSVAERGRLFYPRIVCRWCLSLHKAVGWSFARFDFENCNLYASNASCMCYIPFVHIFSIFHSMKIQKKPISIALYALGRIRKVTELFVRFLMSLSCITGSVQNVKFWC